MAMRNKHKEKRMAQEDTSATEGLRLRSAEEKGRTGRLRGWSDSEEGGHIELKPKRKKRRAVTTTLEHELEEGGHFHVHGTHLGQPGTFEEPAARDRKQARSAQPKEKKKKATCEKESKAEVRHRAKVPKTAKEEKQRDKKEKKKRKKDHGDYPESYGMMGPMLPMMGMMRSMSYPMMPGLPGMMMMPGGIIGAPVMGGVGPMGTMTPYSLPGLPMVRPLTKAPTKEEKRRRFTEAPAEQPAEPVQPVEAVEEPEKRSASVSSSSSSSSTSEAKNEGPPAPAETTVPLEAAEGHGLGEGELELGLISPEPEKEEHSPLQVPPGMESPVASQSPDPHPEASRLTKGSSWVEVEGETMEELQRELEVTCQNKPCASVGTQTETEEPTAEELSEGLGDRWFLGFVDAVVPMPGNKESSDSSDSSDEAEEETTCRPERQLRRRSRSQSQGPEGKPADGAAEGSSSSSSSSSSSGGSRKRQRAPSSDEEVAKATESLAPQMPPVDPRRLRIVQDYSDVA